MRSKASHVENAEAFHGRIQLEIDAALPRACAQYRGDRDLLRDTRRGGRRLSVSAITSSQLEVIDVAERREVARIPVGDYPQRMWTARVPRAAAERCVRRPESAHGGGSSRGRID